MRATASHHGVRSRHPENDREDDEREREEREAPEQADRRDDPAQRAEARWKAAPREGALDGSGWNIARMKGAPSTVLAVSRGTSANRSNPPLERPCSAAAA